MAATYASAIITVMGDKRVFTGVVHLNDGAETAFNPAGFVRVHSVQASQVSCNTGGAKQVGLSSTAGAVTVGSATSGDSMMMTIIGY